MVPSTEPLQYVTFTAGSHTSYLGDLEDGGLLPRDDRCDSDRSTPLKMHDCPHRPIFRQHVFH